MLAAWGASLPGWASSRWRCWPSLPPLPWPTTAHGASGCAEFFGGIRSSNRHALMWQFSGGGGVRNGFGDFDQIDARVVR
jgi:hypothetical protein